MSLRSFVSLEHVKGFLKADGLLFHLLLHLLLDFLLNLFLYFLLDVLAERWLAVVLTTQSNPLRLSLHPCPPLSSPPF